ncbi:MAG: DUF349 domain-containing protein [Bacteroidales bacterium]|nr:DUF349 domain-containing protein [Bacteroidales bacterium]
MEELNPMQQPVADEMPQNIVPETNTEENNMSDNASAEEAQETTATPTTEQVEQETEPDTDYSGMNREELLSAFNELMQNEVQKIKNRVGRIRNQFTTLTKEIQKANYDAFIAGGGLKEDYQEFTDAISTEFQKLYAIFRQRRQQFQDDLEAQKQKNFELKQGILEELRQLIDRDEENIKKTYDEFNVIQDKWKSIGDVPREKVNDLWQNYHFLIEQFFNKVKISKELRMLDLKRNLEQKVQLCEQAEELIVESSITKAFKGLQELRDKWREIGPVPTEQNEDIWQRFCNAANKIDERRKEYYDQRKEEYDRNLLAKQALVEKADELTQTLPDNVKSWNETTDQLDELLKVWKTIGPVPRDVNDEIWTKFKSMIDNFYAEKKNFFGKLRDEQSENYNKKIDLCLKAEAIAKREDWKKATAELLQLQEEWKQTGAVSRKVSEKIWHRFRSACDEFFAKKGEYFNNIHGSEQENLKLKEAIIAELKEHQFGDNKEENLNAIKDFQRRWMEIGFVPIAEKDRLQKEFRGIIDGYFEKLRITAREAEETAYRERIRNIAGDSKKFVHGERQEIQEKIDKLKNDLNVWENNLGFLANSKQADLLKEEFEKKMQGARQQIALLQAKLRILNETEKNEAEQE